MKSASGGSEVKSPQPDSFIGGQEQVGSFDYHFGRRHDDGEFLYIKTANVCISRVLAKSNHRLKQYEDKKGEYKTQVSLVMEKDSGKEFCLLIQTIKGDEKLSLTNLLSSELTRGKQFNFKYEEFEFTLDFLHRREAEIFDKYIARIIQPDLIQEEDIFKPPNTPTKSEREKKKKNKTGLFSGVAISNAGVKDLMKDEKSTDWTFRHVRYWLEHILVQPQPEGGEITTLYNYIERNKFATFLEKYFTERNTIFNLEKQLLLFSNKPEEIDRLILPIAQNKVIREKLLKHIEIIRLNDGYFAKEYFKVLKKRIDSAKKHLKRSQDPNLVLSLNHLESRMLHEELPLWNLRYLRNNLLFSVLYNHSLSSYVSKLTKDFENVLEEEQLRFQAEGEKGEPRKKQEEEEEEEEEGEEEEEEEKEEYNNKWYKDIIKLERMLITEKWHKEDLYLDHKLFERVLNNFNQDHNILLEVLSFPVWLRVKQNLLRRSREKLVTDLVVPIETEEKKLLREVQKARDKIKRFCRMENENQSNDSDSDDEEKNNQKKRKSVWLEKMKKMKEKYESELEEMEEKLSKLQSRLKKMRCEGIPSRRKRINNEIIITSPEYNKNSRTRGQNKNSMKVLEEKEFLLKKQRFDQIDKMIRFRLDEILKKSPIDLAVKLVLSYQRNPGQQQIQQQQPQQQPTQEQQRRRSNKLFYVDWFHKGDELFNFSFFRFGLVHASLIIKNINLHWLANSLVRVNEIGEDYLSNTFNEIACVDVDCPLIFLRKEPFLQKFNSIAKALIHWNARIFYADWHLPIVGQSSSRNCQEFVTFLMKDVLNYTSFYNAVQRYVEKDLKNFVKEKYMTEHPAWRTELMYFPASPAFRQRFKDVLESISHLHLLWAPKNKGIIFRTHEELDSLVHSLQEDVFKNDDEKVFADVYPGEFQLLKSLDRAFWIKAKRGEEEKINLPSKRLGCPFNTSSKKK